MPDQPGLRHIRPSDTATSCFDWGEIKFLCEPALCAAQHLTVGHVRLAPGAGHLRHNHPGSEEILFILSGQGEQMVESDTEENGGEPRFFQVQAGDLVHIPPSVFHQTINNGEGVMELLAVYSPPGPEAVIRGLEDHRQAPPGPWPTDSHTTQE